MIQRKQTLFLLLSIFCSIALTLVNCNFLDVDGVKMGVSVSIIPVDNIKPNIWHFLGTAINIASALLALITIFTYKKRDLQVKLCYGVLLLQLGITLIVSFCPVVELREGIKYESSLLTTVIGLVGMLSAYFAARYIKKDIELLKSAERIR